MPSSVSYDREFFAGQKGASYLSASIVVPHLLALYGAKSVVDFGCGVGTWLRAFQDAGVEDFIGVDGDYVLDVDLQIAKDRFVRTDMRSAVDLGRRFDLAISLEVAEHLPPATATTFVHSLTSHAPVILFSAAVPLQGGTHHVNEQWPQFWISLFKAKGFTCIDCLRDVFWEDDRIAWWYRQNMFLFADAAALESLPGLRQGSASARKFPLAVVHPGFMEKSARELSDPRWLWDRLSSLLRRKYLTGRKSG
jgi:SAM-dependent methyltransferase